ncbi:MULTISPECIES: hypothetical protein [unclassified Pseudomonas]|uniref:hypothetical protein n=1 Tax=unclassified Pseudomonas TaxID=196821 RepID=UPI0030DA3C4D
MYRVLCHHLKALLRQMTLSACLLPLMQQSQGVKATIEQRQRMIERGADQLFSESRGVVLAA